MLKMYNLIFTLNNYPSKTFPVEAKCKKIGYSAVFPDADTAMKDIEGRFGKVTFRNRLKDHKAELIEEIIRLSPFWNDNEYSRKELEKHSIKWLEELAENCRWDYRDRYR